MDNSLGKRIEQIRKIERLEIDEYMQFLDVTKTSYYNWRDGKNQPNAEVLIKILVRFPEYRAEWLLLGKGEMKKGYKSEIVNEPMVNYSNRDIIKEEVKNIFKRMIDNIE